MLTNPARRVAAILVVMLLAACYGAANCPPEFNPDRCVFKRVAADSALAAKAQRVASLCTIDGKTFSDTFSVGDP